MSLSKSFSKPRRLEIFVVGGLICGLWFVLYFTFEQARKKARGASCQSNLKQLGLATIQYVRNYDEKFPLEKSWREDLIPYAKNAGSFHCPARVTNGYAYNGYISRLSLGHIQGIDDKGRDMTPMFFESSLQRANATDFGRSWPKQDIHPQGSGIAFADGHAEWRHAPPVFRSFTPIKPRRGVLKRRTEKPKP